VTRNCSCDRAKYRVDAKDAIFRLVCDAREFVRRST